MILAEKIIKLRKQVGWSQEELALKMDVSRQSVSKWESAQSIPDLNKIIALGDIFGVSTDYLLKDDFSGEAGSEIAVQENLVQINLEQANDYLVKKDKAADITSKGVALCVCSVIPLFFMLALSSGGQLSISPNLAIAIGIVGLLIMVSFGVSVLIKASRFDKDFAVFEKGKFELAYGVHSVYSEKLEQFAPFYHKRLSIGVACFILSTVPFLLTAILFNIESYTLMTLNLLFIIVAVGIYIVVPVSSKYDAINLILAEGDTDKDKTQATKDAEKLSAFYWPLLVAIYLGWSLWTMNWGVTWIVWPVGAVAFAALVGLMQLMKKDEN